MIKDSKISFNPIFGRNSPASIQKKIDHEMLDSVSLALNDGQNETDYLPHRDNLKTVVLDPVIWIYASVVIVAE